MLQGTWVLRGPWDALMGLGCSERAPKGSKGVPKGFRVLRGLLGCTSSGVQETPRTGAQPGLRGGLEWGLSPIWGCSGQFAAGREMNGTDMSGLILPVPRSPRRALRRRK